MPPLWIRTKLDFIDRNQISAHAFGHRLDGADPILGARRHDPLFACDQCHDGRATQGNDAVIDLAREQTQRQPDHPRAMRQHPFDCIGRLACIGRAQNGHDPAVTCHQKFLRSLKRAPDAVAPQPVERPLRVIMVRVNA